MDGIVRNNICYHPPVLNPFERLVSRVACVSLCLLAGSAGAATLTLRAQLDTDNNQSTGCRSDDVLGVEQILDTTIDSSTRKVLGVTQQRCNGLTFDAPTTVDAGGWGVGFHGGLLNVETHVPIALIGGLHPARFTFNVSGGTLFDSVLRSQRRHGDCVTSTP